MLFRSSVQTKKLETQGMGDTGASVCLGGPPTLRSLGITEDHLTKCSMTLYGADNTDINLLGIVPVMITDRVSRRQTKQFLYICQKSPRNILLSLDACIELGYVDSNFPSSSQREAEQSEMSVVDTSVNRAGKKQECDCQCPARALAPDVPTKIPFEPSEANLDKLEKWILDYYAASAFNQCECQPLPSKIGRAHV